MRGVALALVFSVIHIFAAYGKLFWSPQVWAAFRATPKATS